MEAPATFVAALLSFLACLTFLSWYTVRQLKERTGRSKIEFAAGIVRFTFEYEANDDGLPRTDDPEVVDP
ncbi:hypothetical protein Ari01nite_96920 [Paractinoplanes rishiriensis]|uniref:Uncharacterized protein n=1 Tax=Paractinoplanes rishiriensis TaxID=1050105 RepID=A0A919KA23_9ACTN|nr:hypothetical protein Ari01nite_96920 [Actinoplanes rishiriensis]